MASQSSVTVVSIVFSLPPYDGNTKGKELRVPFVRFLYHTESTRCGSPRFALIIKFKTKISVIRIFLFETEILYLTATYKSGLDLLGDIVIVENIVVVLISQHISISVIGALEILFTKTSRSQLREMKRHNTNIRSQMHLCNCGKCKLSSIFTIFPTFQSPSDHKNVQEEPEASTSLREGNFFLIRHLLNSEFKKVIMEINGQLAVDHYANGK